MLLSLLLLPSMMPSFSHSNSAHATRGGQPTMGIMDDVDKYIETNVGKIASRSGVGGGSGWAQCVRYKIEGGKELFVKASGNKPLEKMFLGEGLGLKALYECGKLAIPEVLHYADGYDGGSYIIMEYLDIGGRPDPEAFGRAMAQMHLTEPRDAEAKEGKFGFPVDNTIGATPQPNGWMEDWVSFFRERRIGFQVGLTRDARMKKEWERCLEDTDGLKTLFEDIEADIKPSVLHGDLWSGNIAAVDGKPCIFDPAVYYGPHEAEWGMSWCASLPPAFWKGYRELIPEDPGFRKRAKLYELYHKLNHYNLFGGGYYNDALGLLQGLAD